MFTTSHLPISYEPFDSLNVCSNMLSGGTHILVVNKVLPLIIGQGNRYPRVWMQAPTDATMQSFVQLVNASQAKVDIVSVEKSKDALQVWVAEKLVLSLRVEEKKCLIDQIDLRPVGFGVVGNPNELRAGSSLISRNSMQGSIALIAYGSKEMY